MIQTTNTGTKYKSNGRWIKIKTIYVTQRHKLYAYGDPSTDNKREVLIFKHNGREYALSQFLRLTHPVILDSAILGGYDAAPINPYYPELIELDPNGGYFVRLWEELPGC